MIEIANLTKRYKNVVAVNSLSVSLKKGEIFGLLGPNGAGKTTIIRILSTLANPTKGKVFINGYDVVDEPIMAKSSIGVVHQTLNVDPDIKGYNNLVIHGLLFQMSYKKIKDRIKEVVPIVGLEERINDYVSTYSGGMKRKLTIARALLHEPELLIMDEPTVGLDVLTRRNIWGLIKNLRNRGVTIFLTTHYIEEIEYLADRVAIIDKGRLIELGNPGKLKNQYGKLAVDIYEEKNVNVNFFSNRNEMLKFVSKIGKNYSVRNTTLEDIFVALTGKSFNNRG